MDEICPSCGKWVSELSEETGFCGECSPKVVSQLESYLLANADEIEHYLLQGLSLNQAIDRLHANNGRPRCLVCGHTITRAKRTAVFCRRTKECRRYSRRYVYLYRELGMSKSQALAQVLEELT
jgi:hypothetical protein